MMEFEPRNITIEGFNIQVSQHKIRFKLTQVRQTELKFTLKNVAIRRSFNCVPDRELIVTV